MHRMIVSELYCPVAERLLLKQPTHNPLKKPEFKKFFRIMGENKFCIGFADVSRGGLVNPSESVYFALPSQKAISPAFYSAICFVDHDNTSRWGIISSLCKTDGSKLVNETADKFFEDYPAYPFEVRVRELQTPSNNYVASKGLPKQMLPHEHVWWLARQSEIEFLVKPSSIFGGCYLHPCKDDLVWILSHQYSHIVTEGESCIQIPDVRFRIP